MRTLLTIVALRRWAAAAGLPANATIETLRKARRLEQIARGKRTKRAARFAAAPLTCLGCSTVFVRERNNQRYCTRKCKRRSDNAKQQKRLRLPPRPVIACRQCGAEFVPRYGPHLCCTAECNRQWYNAFRRTRRKAVHGGAGVG